MSGKHRAIRPALIWNDEIVTVPLIPSAALTLHEWHHAKVEEVDEVLRPFGLSAVDIALPKFECVIPTTDTKGTP